MYCDARRTRPIQEKPMSSRIRANREARGQTLGLVIKLIAFVAFLGVIFALGGNPFTGELAEDAVTVSE